MNLEVGLLRASLFPFQLHPEGRKEISNRLFARISSYPGKLREIFEVDAHTMQQGGQDDESVGQYAARRPGLS